jgi:S-DNA-T family DNA segregation ATPase FtsK/SpoIIIE
MVDNMAEDGIVGAYNGSKHREVLITQAQWEDLRDADEATVRLAV